ncbi:MAG TPA: multicopper oxidase domain-containing protein [Gemmatimonadales bacterium]|nr:multicopper oxidase domain-containing protein [Gemmatimonadales bacterium]
MKAPFLRYLAGALVSALSVASASLPGPAVAPRTRTWYIAADELPWDYAPGGRDEIAGRPWADSAFFANASPRPVSSVYRKVLYREYTDSTFQTVKPRPAEWQHLGFLGPVLHAVVGDTIRVVFRNNGFRPFSMHPHGVFYQKSSEGAPYNDGAGDGRTGNGVPPGGTFTYVWPVPERAGPGPMDGSSVLWMYHSHVEEARDINTGLLGAIVVTARAMARPDGTPKDVDREIVTAFAQVEENLSWLADSNREAQHQPDSTARPMPNPSETDAAYPWYVKFTINGYIHGSMPLGALTLRRGQRVRWYVMSSTNDFDVHAPHWHGNDVLVGGMRTDVLSLPFMGMVIANMVPDNVGTWLFHCHVSFHNSAGMAVRYRVTS